MKRIFTCILWLTISFVAYSQHNIQSKVISAQNGELIEMATVRLLMPQDSVLIEGTQSDGNGSFVLRKIKNGKYLLIVSSIGYENYVCNINMAGKDILLKNIYLKEIIQTLSEVEVRGTAAQMVVRGDTTEYNASAFKTAENAVAEELLKKMPGVEIDTDGKITVNGEEVKKVRIDGKKFFGDDIQMATKNIPAEMIDKVQVIDEKSEMAQLTGFEDDETERIINLTLKPNRKRGMFGNFTGALGADMVNSENKYFDYGNDFWSDDFRYNANAFLNLMLGESQTTLIGGANNTNEIRSGRGRNNISSGSGITSTQNIGANTNLTANQKLKIGGNASVNHSNNLTLTDSRKESYSNGKNYTNYDNRDNRSQNWDVSMRLEFEWKIDSTNTLIFQPNITYTNAYTNKTNDFTYFSESDTTSWGNSFNESKSRNINAGMRLIYSHNFAKQGRTLTLNGKVNFTDTQKDGLNQSKKNVYKTGNTVSIDQKTYNKSNSLNYNIRISYVEPIYNNKHFLETALSFSNNNRTSIKNQYRLDSVSGVYSLFDSVYSNNYENCFYSETAEINYRIKDSNYDLMLGIKANPSQTLSYTLYGNNEVRDIVNSVWNFSPTASFKYKFRKKEFARIQYRGTTSQPSIEQLEPAKNNSNAMSETVGNPNLKPAFEQSLRMMYSRFNAERFSSFSAGLRGSLTKDALSINSIYDETGKMYQQTVNAKQMPYSISGDVMYNTPIIQKRLHLNTRTSASYSQKTGYTAKELPEWSIDIDNLILGDPSYTQNFRASENLSLTFTHDVIEIGVRGNVSYSHTSNNLSTNAATNVIDWTATGSFTLHLPYQWTISSDIGYTARYGYNLTDVNELIWNASIDKTLFRNQGTLSLKAFDILNQRKNIREVVGDNYVRYDKYNTLPTYFTLSLTYKLNKMGHLKMTNQHNMPPDFDGRPPMGTPPGPPPCM